MRPRPTAIATARRKRVPILEPLELRRLLSAPSNLTIPLDPTLDQFGDQVVTVMSYTSGAPDPSQQPVGTFGIFDTGASSVTFSPDDADTFTFFNQSIPIKNPGGAVADGIGGGITGDVSAPGTIVADGMHASTLTFGSDGFPDFGFDLTTAAATTPIQAFVGTQAGSSILPTITGTPFLHPSTAHAGGLAALVNMQGSTLDFSDIAPGLVLQEPDIHFVDPSTTIAADSKSTEPVTIPLTFYGDDNFANPGQLITDTHLTTQNDVSVTADPTGTGPVTHVDHQNFLFDTGSQLTVISTAAAQALGLDLSHPTTTIDVQGVGGTETIPGFTVNSLVLPTSAGGTLTFTNVPVYVLDVADGIDGILGMNLLDTADNFLYNPFDPTAAQPTVTFTFLTNPDRSGSLDGSGLSALLDQHGLNFFGGAFAGHSVPDFGGSAVQFAASSFAASASQGSLTINVSRTGNISAAETVHYATADGTAKDGVDYRAVSGSLSFAPGQKAASFSIPLLDDLAATGDLSLNLALSQPGGGASLGTPSTATVTIHNTGVTGLTPVAGTVQFAQPSDAINENAGVATITVTRTGGDAGGVTVGYATADSTAKAGVNYVSRSGTLTFGVGETAKSFTIPILDDGQFDGDTTVALILKTPGGGASLGLSTASLVIHETDPQPQPVLPAAQPATALVTVENVIPSVSRKGVLTAITIGLSGPIDAASAMSLVHYHLARGRKSLPLRSAVYNSGALTITLRPRGRINLAQAMRLSIVGLVDPLGRAVEGNQAGQPAGDVVAVLR
jgi:predicted aspartyl protease